MDMICILSNTIAFGFILEVMTSYYSGGIESHRDAQLGLLSSEYGISLDRLLDLKAESVCRDNGINYRGLEPIQRLFLTHYRCPMCKLVPLHQLNLTYPKRVRCSRCGQLISFRNSGKWGRLRKKIAIELMIDATKAGREYVLKCS
jgi:hypothetical protein